MNPGDREELFELYSELHLACGWAAAALRLAEHWDALRKSWRGFKLRRTAPLQSGSGS